MNKEERNALRTGADENFQKLEYCCPTCGKLIGIAYRRCPQCKAKRPKDAYQRSLNLRKERAACQNAYDRPVTSIPDRTVAPLPLPKTPCYATPGYSYYNDYCYSTLALQQMGVPKFYSTDEYGRVFEMPMCYKPLPYAGPVPVAAPSTVVQTEAINVPVNRN